MQYGAGPTTVRVSGVCSDHQLVQVSLVRSNGAPALAGNYLVDMLHGATDFSVDENIVEDGLQQIPLAGTAELEPGYLQIATVVNERKNDWDAHPPHVEFLTPIP